MSDAFERKNRNPFAPIIAGLLVVGLLAGVAVANPGAVDRAVDRVKVTLFGTTSQGEPLGETGPGASGLPATHTPEDCQAVLDGAGYQAPEGDTTGLDHAVGAVKANCDKNPKAKGLLVALQRLLRNMERQAVNEHGKPEVPPGQAGEHGPGNGHGNGHGNSQTNGSHGPGGGGGPGS